MSETRYPRRTFVTSRGTEYSHIHVRSTLPNSPFILFLHGFPSLAIDFCYQIDYLSSLGYGIVAPDLIGYGASSRPEHPEDYNHKLIAQDLSELLDQHSISTVIGVSHDFGAQVLTRFELYHPHRVSKLAFLTIGPVTIGQEFDLDAVNAMTLKMLGYEGFGYQDFLTRDPDATTLLANHSTSLHDLIFTSEHDLWKDYFGRIGGLKKWLMEKRNCKIVDGFGEELAEAHLRAFAINNGGYEGARNWYVGFTRNLNIADDTERLDELKAGKYQLSKGKKVLLMTAGLDVIAFPAIQEEMTRSYLSDPDSDLTVKQVDSGHWIGIERANEVNLTLKAFFEE